MKQRNLILIVLAVVLLMVLGPRLGIQINLAGLMAMLGLSSRDLMMGIRAGGMLLLGRQVR